MVDAGKGDSFRLPVYRNNHTDTVSTPYELLFPFQLRPANVYVGTTLIGLGDSSAIPSNALHLIMPQDWIDNSNTDLVPAPYISVGS